MSAFVAEPPGLISSVTVNNAWHHVALSGGRQLSLQHGWHTRLKSAIPATRNRLRVVGRAEGIHRHDADEDLSLEGILAGRKAFPA